MSEMRIFLFIDGNNFYYMQRDYLNWWIDYKKLIDWVAKKYKGRVEKVFYYRGIEPSNKRLFEFICSLRRIGIDVKPKEVKIHKNFRGEITRKGDLDVELGVDMVDFKNSYDMAVVLTGDADQIYPIENILSYGNRVLILSNKLAVSDDIKKRFDMYYMDVENIKKLIRYNRSSRDHHICENTIEPNSWRFEKCEIISHANGVQA